MNTLVIDNSSHIIRIARIEGGAVTGLHFEDRQGIGQIGNIYAARVRNVLLKRRFVFLDLGLNRDVFLFAEDNAGKRRYKRGDMVLVQVIKDETPKKGARVTVDLSFVSDFFVLGGGGGIGISRKITNPAERGRLSAFAAAYLPETLGVIIRTRACGVPEENLREELNALLARREEVFSRGSAADAPCLVYGCDNPLMKALNAVTTSDIQEIIINNIEETLYDRFRGTSTQITVYDEKPPIFERYGIERHISEAQGRKVWLKSGGYLIIERTEACVTIDVNSGRCIRGSHAKMIDTVNYEAAEEAARQIRLRNLSGLIMIDFINPPNAADTAKLIKHLKSAIKTDSIPVKVAYVADIAVALITRKYKGAAMV